MISHIHPRYYNFLKRLADICFSLVIVVFLLSWLTPILFILIKLSSKGPLFFVQKRIGFRGRVFKILKFRTMQLNCEADSQPSRTNDSRITYLGRWLRNTGIDELPQCLNILKGDMTFIGPRPHMISEEENFCRIIPGFDQRHKVLPGITGLAQVKGCRGVTSSDRSVQHRLKWDLLYVRNQGFRLECFILTSTIKQLGGFIFRTVSGKRKQAAEKREPNNSFIDFQYGFRTAGNGKA